MRQMLKVLERIAVAAGLLLTFFAAVEILRAYTILRDTHPYAGYGFLLLLGALIGYVIYQFRAIARYRTALAPPELPDDGPVTAKQAKAYTTHLGRVAARLETNPELRGESTRLTALRTAVSQLPDVEGDGANVRDAVLAVERDQVAPLIAILDKRAEAVVSDSVGIVSLGTALSPYRSVDLYIVLARNARMINRILRIYRTRPSTRETVKVFYDIARVVAAVNLINAMDNVWTGLGRHVPFLGRYGEAMSEGLFSGLLTSVAGHAAIDRCRSYRPWSKEEAVRAYRGKLHRWSLDVFSILKRHGADRLKRKPVPTDPVVDREMHEDGPPDTAPLPHESIDDEPLVEDLDSARRTDDDAGEDDASWWKPTTWRRVSEAPSRD